ncbi:hypothetical protein NQZ68_011995 [Dissostichus eleginoides]|nr:hypothetical protein NQZ68_011995 [Dissostichus eleginoides]
MILMQRRGEITHVLARSYATPSCSPQCSEDVKVSLSTRTDDLHLKHHISEEARRRDTECSQLSPRAVLPLSLTISHPICWSPVAKSVS